MPVNVVWREALASRRRNLLEGMILIAVIALALLAGYHFASGRSQARQQAVAQGINDSIDRIMKASRIDERRLANLAGTPCPDIQAELTLRDVFVPYRRSAMMVQDGLVYCATLLGHLSIPVTAYLGRGGAGQQITLLAGTPMMPDVPVMVIYAPVDNRRGILYVVEGAYIADILARARTSGARSASVSDGSGGTITSDGRFVKTDAHAPGMSEILVRVEADAARLRADLILTEIFALLAGLTACAVLIGGYHAGFTPRQRLERQVRAGLRRNEFYVEYQAIVDLETGAWIGAEALLRWRHPRLGLIMPGTFIGEIETTSVIAPLTDFVLATALAELESCSFPDGFRVNINLAPKHIEMHCFPHDIASTLRNRPARFQVVLEITERGLLNGLATSHGNLTSLRRYGVKYAIDDFGTDNSNLALLQRFPFDYIKIDRQFTIGIASHGRQLVEGITYLANKLHLTVVAEGVEEPGQRDALKEIGIRYAQGYLFQRPASILEFERMYRHSPIAHNQLQEPFDEPGR
ncbi:diguanylate phosphodiesterase [Paraburkholderia hospita]|uniref:cyclic-guanylate-specific phosphodiesterase n=1 Tax=Paraburkholderia hospita TaxID=169430 RepID=A0ABN0F7Q4_9BURK|nr:EAL domain-containing protein [Paraburkholderia hospita]EIM94676.1 diguanylate phosphodiesterase [Paraburkholderia hospita]OUL77078.1 diguanylate phosphodiesterase [Paraburkholderia hospita]